MGGFLDGIKMFSPDSRAATRTVLGPAVTVKMIEMSDQNAPSTPKHFADCNERGKIMYIQQPKGLYSACWGGLMSTRAKHLGAEAVIIDGRMRDIREHQNLGFSVSILPPPETQEANIRTRRFSLVRHLY